MHKFGGTWLETSLICAVEPTRVCHDGNRWVDALAVRFPGKTTVVLEGADAAALSEALEQAREQGEA